MIPRATYRLQFHAGFTFADAERIVPYLRDLGISHVYASPITTARPGSLHGYDVTDATAVNPELGGEAALRRLVHALRAKDIGLIVDIVPNHMAAGHENGWWMDVLRLGPDSDHARFFDIDWSRHSGRVLLPFLGAPLAGVIDNGDVRIVTSDDGEAHVSVHGEQLYPLRPGSAPDALRHDPGTPEGKVALAALLDRQHYRLAWWRTGHDELNWRRFFSITELAGLRVEDPAVFDAVHALPLRLYREGLLDGLRIDHIDGLTDPAAYLRRLRHELSAREKERPAEAPGGEAYLIVEKILGRGETLPADWPAHGTTGYEFMDQVSGLLHDGAGEAELTGHWARLSGRPADFAEEELLARGQMLHWQFTAQFDACVDAVHALARRSPTTAKFTRAMWARAVEALLLVFPVYRTYGTGADAPASDAAVRAAVRERLPLVVAPGEIAAAEHVLDWLAGEGPDARHAAEAVRRFQQLSAPIAAKAVEDTAFYRYGRLLSRSDVGFDAGIFAYPPEAFHEAQAERARSRPHSMLATATHDHKRGEDVRARLAVLSELPAEWIERSGSWRRMLGDAAEGIDPGDLYMLLQTIVGAWPEPAGEDDAAPLRAYAERLGAWQVKALREAKLRSSWVSPATNYESRLTRLIDALLCTDRHAGVRRDMHAFVRHIAPAARANSLTQTFLRTASPGVPDLYQGTELTDTSLVDPDNRRPVDFARRAETLRTGADEKQRLIRSMLELRARSPELLRGSYVALDVAGPRAANLLAFLRTSGPRGLCCVAQRCLARSRIDGSVLRPDFWRDTYVELPGPWRSTTGTVLDAALLFGEADDNLLDRELPLAAVKVKAAH